VSRVNPIIYMVNAFRYGFLGVSDVSLASALSLLLLFVAVLYGVAHYLIAKGIGLRS